MPQSCPEILHGWQILLQIPQEEATMGILNEQVESQGVTLRTPSYRQPTVQTFHSTSHYLNKPSRLFSGRRDNLFSFSF